MNKKKIYISIPISGRNIERVKADCLNAKIVIEYSGFEAVSPLDVSPDSKSTYAEHMGNDIAALLNCDAAVFLDDWQLSSGCKLERRACEIYDKLIFNGLDDLEDNKQRMYGKDR